DRLDPADRGRAIGLNDVFVQALGQLAGKLQRLLAHQRLLALARFLLGKTLELVGVLPGDDLAGDWERGERGTPGTRERDWTQLQFLSPVAQLNEHIIAQIRRTFFVMLKHS